MNTIVNPISVTADVMLFRYADYAELQVLLIKRGGELEHGKWAIPGGHMDLLVDSRIEEAAVRELREETGVDLDSLTPPPILRIFTSQHKPGWNGFIYWACLDNIWHNKVDVQAGDDALDARWFYISDLEKLDTAFEHKDLIRQFVSEVYANAS